MSEPPDSNSNKKSMSLHNKIFIGMGLGLVLGFILMKMKAGAPEGELPAFYEHTVFWTKLIGHNIFIGGLKMLIAPLIFAAIVSGVTSLPGMSELKSIGGQTLFYYAMTTTVAVAIGIAMVLMIQPGKTDSAQKAKGEILKNYEVAFSKTEQAKLQGEERKKAFADFIGVQEGAKLATDKKLSDKKSQSNRPAREIFRDDIISKIMTKPFLALSQNTTLGLIFFGMLIGLSCLSLGEKAKPVVDFFVAFNDIMIQITWWFMKISPIAIACLMAELVGTVGISVLEAIMWYSITVVIGIAIHVIFLNGTVKVLGKRNPLDFLKGIRSAWMIAFSTTSSSATLPVTMNCVTDNLKVDKKVANFTLPLGATVNMDGTALYEGIAVIFLIQMFNGMPDVNIALNAGNIFLIFLTAAVAAVGAAAVPGAGLITMFMVATAVGLPAHYVAVVLPIDRVLDMFRTSTNVMGDAAVAVIVDRSTATT